MSHAGVITQIVICTITTSPALAAFCRLANDLCSAGQIAHCFAVMSHHARVRSLAGPVLTYIQNSVANTKQSTLQQAMCDGL